MREILFRGKRTYNGEWVDGYLAAYDLICPNYPEDTSNATGDYYGQTPYVGFVEVEPSTVGQYTGLKDKNGKKVFEGDILKFTDTNADYEWIGRVEFGNPNAEYNWGFQLVFIKGEKPNTDILLWFDMEETGAFSEVIGNIHDNKLEDFDNGC